MLVEGDDMNEPVADCVRSILDGHIVLSRQLASENHYPAIDVLESISRLNRDLTNEKQQALSGRARNLLSMLRKNQDLINIGAYVAGSNPELDQAIRLQKPLRDFLLQGIGDGVPTVRSWEMLERALCSTGK